VRVRIKQFKNAIEEQAAKKEEVHEGRPFVE
jgi:hypothetical protein